MNVEERSIEDCSMQKLCNRSTTTHSWPGNYRDARQNVLKHMVHPALGNAWNKAYVLQLEFSLTVKM